jgi:hypothetical protein
MIPKTYLLTAPAGESNPFGATIHSNDLIKGLRRCNNQIVATPVNPFGMQSLWLGPPNTPDGRKICALNAGPIPEWTQQMPGMRGMVEMRGWRSILETVWQRGAVRLARLEREFKISLGAYGGDDTCPQCRREGNIQSARGGLACALHNNVSVHVRAAKQMRKDAPLREASLARFARRSPVSVNLSERSK